MTDPLCVPANDLCASADIADFLGVGAPTVSNWKQRHPDFPKPIAVVARGNTDIYRKSEIIRWYRQRLSPERLAALKEIVSEL